MKHLDIPFEEGFVRLRTPETAANLAKVSSRHWYAEAAKEPWPEPGPDE